VKRSNDSAVSVGTSLDVVSAKMRTDECAREEGPINRKHRKNGGGNKERDLSKFHTAYLNKVKKNPNTYQILCANCNWIKRYKDKECDWGKWKIIKKEKI